MTVFRWALSGVWDLLVGWMLLFGILGFMVVLSVAQLGVWALWLLAHPVKALRGGIDAVAAKLGRSV